MPYKNVPYLMEEKMLAKFFVDESLIFLKAKPNNLKKSLNILQLFATT